MQDDGTWNTSENAKYAGLKRKTYLYDNSNEEDESKLIESSIEATEKANGTDTLTLTLQRMKLLCLIMLVPKKK